VCNHLKAEEAKGVELKNSTPFVILFVTVGKFHQAAILPRPHGFAH
jgi:hypothetical protein